MNDKNGNQNRMFFGIGIGIIAAVLSCVIVAGIFLLALSEVVSVSPAISHQHNCTNYHDTNRFQYDFPTSTLHPTVTTRPTEPQSKLVLLPLLPPVPPVLSHPPPPRHPLLLPCRQLPSSHNSPATTCRMRSTSQLGDLYRPAR